MARSKVAVISTFPETVRDDCRRLLSLLSVGPQLGRAEGVLLAPDLVRTQWFPSTGTTPWQLDGVLGYLREERIAADRQGIVVRDGARLLATRALDTHCLGPVFRQYGVNLFRVEDEPVLPPSAFGERSLLPELWSALRVPQRLQGQFLILLPALRMRPGFTVAAGIANWAQLVLPKPPALAPAQFSLMLSQLVGLLADTCVGTLVVADATIFGDGAGPATTRPSFQNVLLASTDPVALEAVAASLSGIEPRRLPHLRLCAAAGLGRCELSEIDILGEEITNVSFAAAARRNLANVGDPPHRGRLAGRLATACVRTGVDRLFESFLWRQLEARPTLRRFERTPWGRLFASYRSLGA